MPLARRLSLSFATLVLAAACGGPLVMIPGGALSGGVKPAPTDWSFTDSIENVQLETRPSDPYSVNVWGIGDGNRFLIAAGGGLESEWAKHIVDDSRVRLRIGGDVYEMNALLSEEAADRDAFLEAAKKKYDFEPDEEDTARAVVFVLRAR